MSKFETLLARDALVPPLELDAFGPKFRKMSEKTAKEVGWLSNSVRAMAHADDMAAAARTFLNFAAVPAGIRSAAAPGSRHGDLCPAQCLVQGHAGCEGHGNPRSRWQYPHPLRHSGGIGELLQ